MGDAGLRQPRCKAAIAQGVGGGDKIADCDALDIEHHRGRVILREGRAKRRAASVPVSTL